MSASLESLLRSGSERLDRNRFIQNLLLDNLLLVDIYNQAKKLGITVEQRRVVYLIEPKNPDDTIVLDMIRGIYSSGTGDFVTAVDEGQYYSDQVPLTVRMIMIRSVRLPICW